MFLAQQVKAAHEEGRTPLLLLVAQARGRQVQTQAIGYPAVWDFPDGSRLEIFGRGTSRRFQVSIDATPTWEQILPTWLMMYRQAILGDCTNPSLVRENAEKEFRTMAQAADKWNAHCKEMRS